eukprot:4947398-Prymnesium_polylepis.1
MADRGCVALWVHTRRAPGACERAMCARAPDPLRGLRAGGLTRREARCRRRSRRRWSHRERGARSHARGSAAEHAPPAPRVAARAPAAAAARVVPSDGGWAAPPCATAS